MPYYQSNGLKLYYEDHGAGEPLVLLHGFGQDSSAWIDVLPTYKRFFRVLPIDMRGAGRSAVPEPGYAPGDAAEDVVALIEHLGVEKVHFAGFSLGGAVALELGIGHSDRLRSLSLHSTWQGGPCPHMDRWVNVRHRIIKTEDPVAINGTRVLNFFSPEFLDAHEDRVDAFFKRVADYPYPNTLEGVAGHIQASLKHDARTRLDQITVPTLITVGSLDRTTLPSQARYLHEHIAGSELNIIDGSGHCTKYQCLDQFLSISLGFLIKHQAQ